MRLVVSRTARLCTSGTIIRPNSIEIRKPIARYMIGSIMKGTPRYAWKIYQTTMPRRAVERPAQWRVNVNKQTGICKAWLAGRLGGQEGLAGRFARQMRIRT